jgi:D-beta-D-heptose 7-phosphate kinase/D-beta-D-heptose 1-phosphate adenosyltransferase
MSLFRGGAAPVHMGTQAREVFDVSGAGDTVVATMAMGLAAGMDVETAMAVANSAAGVVVAKLGTATCSPDELEAALARSGGRETQPVQPVDDSNGAVSWEEAQAAREAWRKEGLSVGFANGCFDLIHPGHVTLLRKAAGMVDRLIVAINSDASVSRLKGPSRPVQQEEARAQVLLGIKGVALVTVFGEPTPLELIEKLVPDVLIKGADYSEDEVVGGDVVKAAGGRVALIDLVAGQSTSALVRRANEGEG